LLGDHESVFVQITSNGTVLREEYLSKQYRYSFQDAEFMNFGVDYASLTTDHSEYYYFDTIRARNVTLTPDGMIDMEEYFSESKLNSFISSAMLDDTATIIEKDGFIIVSCTANLEEIIVDETVISCVEIYTLDAKTREIVSVKTVYTFEDGTVEEGISTITRDVDMPEGMKEFLEYDKETENMRTVTIVSNPGTENEKTESIQLPRGLQVSVSPDWEVEELMTLYADKACTQIFEEEWDVNTDLTVYVKWG
jgi:hypothetical protein